MQTLLSEPMLRELNARFETSDPTEILRWALLDSGLERVAIASAFQAEGTAVMHMAARIRPDVPILFLETGFHFAETLAFKQKLTETLGLNVIDLVGDYTVDSQSDEFGPRLYERDPHLCCELNKVIPWRRALLRLDGWVTSMRRDSAWTRAGTPIVGQEEVEPGKTVVKINPVANWTRRDVWAYLKEHDLPRNPLYDLGYASIGCAPCTRIVFPGEDERAGRWAGSQKIECGIHVPESLKTDGEREVVRLLDPAEESRRGGRSG
jgi:phosphoadenosine phosphosulfate reductase